MTLSEIALALEDPEKARYAGEELDISLEEWRRLSPRQKLERAVNG